MLQDYLKLHFIVVIWGFTAILGVLISVPALETVFYRTLITSICLYGICRYYNCLHVSRSSFIKIFLTGTLVGMHWVLFFASVNVGSASVGLAGLSTTALWTAFLEPLILKRKFAVVEILLGLMVVGGLYLIFQYETDQWWGLMLGIAAALLACVFSIFNAALVRSIHHLTITFYGMTGACAVTLIAVIGGTFVGRPAQFNLTGRDIGWLMILSLICTVYPYAATLELLKRLTVFSASLSINMEPVYGMILAALILGEHNTLTPGFYFGTAVIMTSIFIYLAIQRSRLKRTRNTTRRL